jgi:GH25 family lysozyme M1 (1,4-beta-N-acetylmuramidase)
MTYKLGHASKTETNGIVNGQSGDQTGVEVTIRSYYMHSKGWYLIRPKSAEHANKIAEAMIRACNNDNIGYDQNGRLGVITYGTNSSVKTECDCSSLVRQCVIEGTGKDPGNFTTGNQKTMLLATGLFENAISVTSYTVMYTGDILVTKTKGHTAIIVEGNTRSSSQNTEKGDNKMLKGIDTSKWQNGQVNFNAAKEAGYEFVFLRIGYNKSKDAFFESDYAKAKAAGMKVGVYFYATSLSEAEAINDANRVLGWLSGKTLDFPIAYDLEEASMKSSSRKDLNSKQFNAFADTVRAKGFIPMLYTGESMFNNYFNKNMITDQLWIAKYGVNQGLNNGAPNVGKTVAIHQYTSAAIPSDFYSAKLDRNQMMISYEELMKKNNTSTNTTVKPTVPATSYTKKQCVKDIQTLLGGLVVDGLCGAKTLAKLPLISKKHNPKHKIVKPLQRYLNALGYDCGTADGIAGTKFHNAVVKFQKANGLTADGILGQNSYRKLIGM